MVSRRRRGGHGSVGEQVLVPLRTVLFLDPTCHTVEDSLNSGVGRNCSPVGRLKEQYCHPDKIPEEYSGCHITTSMKFITKNSNSSGI